MSKTCPVSKTWPSGSCPAPATASRTRSCGRPCEQASAPPPSRPQRWLLGATTATADVPGQLAAGAPHGGRISGEQGERTRGVGGGRGEDQGQQRALGSPPPPASVLIAPAATAATKHKMWISTPRAFFVPNYPTPPSSGR